MKHAVLLSLILGFLSLPSKAQFYTITKDSPVTGIESPEELERAENKADTVTSPEDTQMADFEQAKFGETDQKPSSSVTNKNIQKRARKTSLHDSYSRLNEKGLKIGLKYRLLPQLTIDNLYLEIRRNGIKYPRIVLAQAILETGWFRSNVCRNKHNLFGLTNPKTGYYYEFEHWTQSVKAYYDKVQYKYKGGNYLKWLDDIGYAEDPGYIQAIISVLNQLEGKYKRVRPNNGGTLQPGIDRSTSGKL